MGKASGKTKTAVVNGQEIPAQAVQFELDRLVKFYANHGVSAEDVRKSLDILREKALEQAIGAKLLLDRASQLDLPVTAADIDREVAKVVEQVGGEGRYREALAAQGLSEDAFRRELEKGARVDMLVEQACAHVQDPTEDEVAAFYEANKSSWGSQTLVDAHDRIKDLLRHEARGRAMDLFIEELRESATIEYK